MKYILGGVYISNCNKINLENCGLPKVKIYVVTRGVRRIWEKGGEFLFRTCGPPPLPVKAVIRVNVAEPVRV